MKAKPRTYDRGFTDGIKSTIDLLLPIFGIALHDKTGVSREEYNSVKDTVNLYAEQILAGEITLDMVKEAEAGILED